MEAASAAYSAPLILNLTLSVFALFAGFVAGWWLCLRKSRIEVPSSFDNGLDGLADRRIFDAVMRRSFAEWQRLETPFSVVLIGWDEISWDRRKSDRRKSDTGKSDRSTYDSVLRGMADAIRCSMREMDFICRYSRAEFAVIMPQTGVDQAAQGALRAYETIQLVMSQFKRSEIPMTLGTGVAEVRPEDSVYSLIRRAEAAVIASKQTSDQGIFFHDGQQACALSDDDHDSTQEWCHVIAPKA